MTTRKFPLKKYFDVKVECTLPATVTFRVLAESPEQALELSKRASPTSVKYVLPKRRDIKAIVYDAGTVLIRFTKNLLR